jgi:RNA polymerase sigma-70 factor (ECF subfamily)
MERVMDSMAEGRGPSEDDVLVEIGAIAHRYAQGLVDRDMAHDVAQDVVVFCLEKMRARQWRIDRSTLRRYVWCLVRRRLIVVLRRKDRLREREADHARERRQSPPAWMHPESALEAKELEAFEQETLNGLPRQSRRAWRLVREQRLSYKTAARVLGVSRATLCSNLARAERLVRERMREQGVAGDE